jgi:trehalose-6-phosphate synthase
LIAGVTVISVASTYFDVLAHRHVLRQQLDRQTKWMTVSIVPSVQAAVASGNLAALPRLTQQLKNSTGALGLAVYDAHGNLLTSAGPDPVMGSLTRSVIPHTLQRQIELSDFSRNGHWEWLEHALPLRDASNQVVGAMAVVADAGYIRDDANAFWRTMFWRIAALVLLIVVITAGMVSWFLLRPLSRITERLQGLRTGRGLEPMSESGSGDLSLFTPITREVETMAESLKAARAAAATEARLRESGEPWWTAEKLALHIRKGAGGSKIFVVSNREPYMHVRRGRELECVVPPSGLVTALEPILRACDGVWVASGNGSGDTTTVDEFDHLRVPPDDPKYTLRRVWLTEEEEAQYYDGFANEGLWPLCHIAHTRPIFRPGDWECYQAINERFARALLAEMKNSPNPIVFAQDYHLALLPQMVKRARPDARVAIFWHIPWPNPEAFGICPWQNEILDGMLGADLIGFHIPLHCHNFLATVDRALEARTNHEHLTTSRRGHLTTVHAYPVSVACEGSMRPPDSAAAGFETSEVQRENQQTTLRARLLQPFGLRAEYLAVGVDRLDYTKGIVERLMALEQLLEERPWYRDRLTLLQIAAPSRTRISTYVDLRVRVEETAERINARYQTARWKPVVLVERQCNHNEVAQWYCAADLCLVTSLHDGMNLVAKEFVAERNDEDGVLVLSRFAGAAGELVDALLVNPYDVAGVAEAMHRGLQMSRPERRERMRRMRRQVMEHNIYLWAANILGDLREVRIEGEEQQPAPPQSLPSQGNTAGEELQRRTA